MDNPIFEKIVSTKTVKAGQRYLKNHNKLLWQLEGADGVKTGYTRAAGRILVSSAKRNGRRIVVVTISDPNDWQDHINLFETGFHRYTEKMIVTEGDTLGTVELAGGEDSCVQLVAKESFSYPLSEGENIQVHLPQPGFVYAPVAENQHAGYAHIYLDNVWIGRVPIVYGNTVEQKLEQEPGFWQRLLGG